MALSPDEKFIYVNPDTTAGEYNLAQYFPVKYIRGLECANAANFYIYFRGPKDATSTRLTVSLTSGFIKEFFTQFVDEINFGEKSVITLADRNASVDATTGGTDFQHVNADVSSVILSDVTFSGHEDVQVAEDLDVAGVITGDLTGDVTGDVTGTASIATSVTVADESTDTSCFPLFSTAATGNLEPKSGSNLRFNSSSGLLMATSLAGTLTTAAQTNITSLGTLTALDVDHINLNDKTIAITGDTDDTFSIVAGANGATTLTTVDAASNLGHFEIAADGHITLDANGDIMLEAAGNDITMDADTLTIESSSFLSPYVTLKSTGNNAFAGYFAFSKFRADDSPADNDTIGSVIFAGEDAGGASEVYGSIVGSIVEADHGDEAGKIQILVANDGTERNGITMSGDKGTAAEVDVTIANGAASVTTIAGTLTMGSTPALTNAGLVAVANQSNITSVGTLTALTVDALNLNSNTISSTDDGDVFLAISTNGINFEANAGDKFTYNGNQNNVDLQYASENDQNVFYIDASADKVGIGTSTPAAKLDVVGDISSSGVATVASLTCTAAGTFGGGYGSTGATISTAGVGQFNGALNTDSTLSCVAGLTVAGNSSGGGYLRLHEDTDNGTSYIALRAPAALTTNTTLLLPDGDGSANQVIKTDGAGNLSWTDMSGGGSTQKVYFNGGVNLQYPYNRFLPIGSHYVIEQNTDANPEFTTFVAPYDGKLIKTMLRSEEALGNTSLTWYKVGDGTEEPDQGSTVDTKTVDIASAATTYTYTYDADATFSKGDAMSVAIDPTTDPVGAGVSYTIVMEFDEST